MLIMQDDVWKENVRTVVRVLAPHTRSQPLLFWGQGILFGGAKKKIGAMRTAARAPQI